MEKCNKLAELCINILNSVEDKETLKKITLYMLSDKIITGEKLELVASTELGIHSRFDRLFRNGTIKPIIKNMILRDANGESVLLMKTTYSYFLTIINEN